MGRRRLGAWMGGDAGKRGRKRLTAEAERGLGDIVDIGDEGSLPARFIFVMEVDLRDAAGDLERL